VFYIKDLKLKKEGEKKRTKDNNNYIYMSINTKVLKNKLVGLSSIRKE